MVSRRWLIAALVVLGLVGGCSQFNTNLTTQTSTSFLQFLSPASVPAGSVPSTGLLITATGAGFVTGAKILWNVGPNQIRLDATFVSSATLTATVPASNFPTGTTAPVTVPVAIEIPGSSVSPTSNTGATTTTELSNVFDFTISPPQGQAPTITSISAPATSLASTPYCQPNGFTLTVNGTNFVNRSAVNWNGSPRTTTFVSSQQLTALILATDAAFPVPVGVTVSNPSGPAPSNTKPFTLTTPTNVPGLPSPIISSLSQTSVTAGSPTFTLTVTGSSFVPCSVVQWDGVTKATAYVSPTQLDATIPAADVFNAGSGGMTPRTVNVTVFTLPPGGGSSTPITFTINP